MHAQSHNLVPFGQVLVHDSAVVLHIGVTRFDGHCCAVIMYTPPNPHREWSEVINQIVYERALDIQTDVSAVLCTAQLGCGSMP